MSTYWKNDLLTGLPVLKSIVALPEFQKQTNKLDAIKYWVPVAKTYASTGTTLSPALASVDGGQPLNSFAQTMLAGNTDATTALKNLQSALSSIVK
jgi:multiple sugar transport system substrate-binding protein